MKWSRASAVCAAALSAAVLMLGAGAASAQPGPVHAAAAAPQNPTPLSVSGQGDAVSCPTASKCITVGLYSPMTFAGGLLTELWNGKVTSVIQNPTPSGAISGSLDAISCGSGSSCMAAGSYTTSKSVTLALAESWNGSRWSIASIPSPKGTESASLNGISCASPKSCIAVGVYATSALPYQAPLAESWNGSRWSIVSVPDPKGFDGGLLAGVSCASATRCTAVGEYSNSSDVNVPLAESWNGAAWSVVGTPSPKGAQSSQLSSVSCASSTRCMATGSYLNSSSVSVTLAESWNGSRWSVVASPNPANANLSTLTGVSCVSSGSSSRCLAVGHNYTSGDNGDTTLAESWNGTAWSLTTSPSPAVNSSLYAVSCAAAKSCFAVGTFFNSSNNYATLAESWNGKALTLVNQDATLPAVSCVTAADCLAVGSSLNGSVSVTLAQAWNGSSWSVVSTPNPAGAKGSYLDGITCVSSDQCIAVGYYFNPDLIRMTLIESWNGSDWTVVRSPNPSGATYSVLNAVACASATSCMAVGSATGRTLAESWNGSTWSVVTSPSPSNTAYSELDGVSCPTTSECLAVGYNHDVIVGADVTLTESWSGSAWSIVASPAPGSDTGLASVLSNLACTSATQCLAVGTSQTSLSTADQATLTERWTGSAWVVQSSPSPTGSSYSELDGISCRSTGRCMSVGSYYTKAGNHVTLSETWNGTTWSIAASPDPVVPPPGITYLQGVSCAGPAKCLATGTSGNPGGLDPLGELWNGSTWHLLHTPKP